MVVWVLGVLNINRQFFARLLTEFPTQCTVRLSARTKNIRKINTMDYEFDLSEPYKARMDKAMDLLNRELQPNINYMALKASLKCTTLSRR